MTAVKTRTVHYYTVAPALAAYLTWLNGRLFDHLGYDIFVAGYRARLAEEKREASDA